MAAKPTPGGSDGTYGIELNDFLDVSLADDGKIKDGAVFSTSAAPSVDAGVANKKYVDDRTAEGVTGGNESTGETSLGPLQLKWGTESVAADTIDTVVFTSKGLTAFDNFCMHVQVCYSSAAANITNPCGTDNATKTQFRVTNGDDGTQTINWFAIGR